MKSSKSQEKLIGGNIMDHINQRKKQMAEMEATSSDLLAEAMQRAMSGGRPKSLGRFMKKLEGDEFSISPQKVPNVELNVDFSNSYLGNARNKTPTNARIGELTLLNQKPKLYVEPTAPQIMKPMINLNIAEKGKPETNPAEDNFSMETKSQYTDNHLTDRAANKTLRNNVTETFDAQMAQQFMIKKQRTTVNQNSKESSQQSLMSERNFELTSNDNQNEEQPLTANKIIEFQMDDEATNIQDQEPNIDLVRQFNLENKRSNTASANASIQIFNQEKQQEMVDFERESSQPSLNYAGDVLNIISHPSQYANSEVGDGAAQREEKEATQQDEISEEESPEPRQNFPLQRTSAVIANPNHFVQPRSKSGQMLNGPKYPMTQSRAAYKPAENRVRLSTQAFGLLGKGPSSVSQCDKVTPTKSSRNLENKLSSSQQKQPWGLSVNCSKRSNVLPSPRESAKSKSPIGQNSMAKNYAKSTYSRQGLKETVVNQSAEVTEEKIKQDMVDAFTKIRLDLYSDVLRIKKPQNQAFLAGQMLCKLVNSFRGGSQKSNNDLLFQEWKQVQDFIHKKPNVIKFNQEITQLIQHMILSQDYLRQLKSNQLKNHLSKLSKIQQQYFGHETHEQVLQHFATNRNFQTIANICFTVIRYVLFQAGRTELINLKNTKGTKGSTKEDACSAYNQTQSNFSGKKSYSSYVNTRSNISVNKLNIGNSRQNSALKQGTQHSSRNTDALSANKNGSGEGFNSTNRSVINTLKTPRQNLVRNSIKSPLPRQLNMRSASREKLFTPSSRNYSGQKQNTNQDSQSRSKTLYEIMLQKQKQSSQEKLERLTFNSHSKRPTRVSINSAQKSAGGDSSSKNGRRLAQAESRQLFKTPIRDLILDGDKKQESPLLQNQQSGLKSGKKSLCSGQKRQLQGLKKINNATMSQNFNKGVEANSRSAEACKTRKRRKDRGQRKSVCSTKPRLEILQQNEVDATSESQKSTIQEEESMAHNESKSIPFQKAPNNYSSTLLPVQMNSRPQAVVNQDLGSLNITTHLNTQMTSIESDLGTPLDISGLPNAERMPTEGDRIMTESSQGNHLTSQSDDQVNLTTESDNGIEQQMQVCAPQPASRPEAFSRVASHVTSQGVAYEISSALQQFDSNNAYVSVPRVEQPAPLQQVQVLAQADVHEPATREELQTIEPTEVEMVEQQTAIKNFERTQELIVGSPSVPNSLDSSRQQTSHQTSMSSFDPDSYRADAFNIAALLRADCVTDAEASATVIEVQSPAKAAIQYEESSQSVASDLQSCNEAQLSQRTNTAGQVRILPEDRYNNEHFASEFCPQTEKKSNYSSLYQMDKVSVPFEHETMNQSIYTEQVGIEQTVKKNVISNIDHGVVESNTPTIYNYDHDMIFDNNVNGTFDSNEEDQQLNQTFQEPRESHRRETSLSQTTTVKHQITAINTHNNSQHESENTENEEVLMTEIISPFRKSLFTGTQSSIGLKESLNATVIQSDSNDGGWQINPIQMKKVDFNGEDANQYDAQEDHPGRDYSESDCSSPNKSVCESPVKGQIEYEISPGKLKSHVSQGTREVLDQIDNIVNEIIENSPSKHLNSTVNHDMIARLKERRLLQKSQQRTASQQSSTK